MMQLKKYKLGQICTIIPGYAFKANDFGEGNNVVVKIADIKPPYIDVDNADHTSYTPKESRTQIKRGDFVMAMIGATIGKIGILIQNVDNVYINQRVCTFIPKEGFDKNYLFYLLAQDRFRQFVLANVDSSSAQPNIGHNTLYNYEQEIPTIEHQRIIASILSNLDRKIALNRAINRNLEALAKQLYDYWFVQFDFPDEHGRPYKSSGGKMVWNEVLKREVPEGWEVKPLNEWLEIKSGFSFKSDSYLMSGKYKIITIKNVQENHLDTSGCDYIDSLPEGIKDWSKLKVDDRLISLTGNCGRLCIVTEKDLLLNQRVGLLYCDNSEKEFVYRLLCSTEFQTLCSNLAKGAAQANLSPIELCKQNSIYPPEKILSAFGRSMKPITEQYINNEQQNSDLVKRRDELLPLLMNGQITVNSDL